MSEMFRVTPLLCGRYIVSLLLIVVMGLEGGLVGAIVVSLLFLIFISFRPAFRTLGRLPGTNLFVDADRFEDAVTVRGGC